jgi:hypothetical protein
VTGSLLGLLAANVLYFAVGVGLLPILRIARTWAEVLARLPLAYLLGVACASIVAAHLALIEVPLGLAELVVLAGLVLLVAWRRLRGTATSDSLLLAREPAWSTAVGAVAFVLCAVLLVHAWRTFEIRPLLEWDGWAIWGTRARALYEFGGATGPVFTTQEYLPLQHPLLLPALEAMDFRVMSAFDPTLIHVQLLLLAVGFLAAFATLLRDFVPDYVIGLVALALLAAEPVLKQLSTNMADVPLALFVGLGLAGLGRWLVTDETWPLVAGAAFLAAATLTKNEGAMFVLVAFVAAVPAARGRLRTLGLAALGVALVLFPWRLNVALRDLPLVEYDLSNALSPSYLSDHSDRVSPAARGLAEEIFTLDWGVLPLVFAVGLVAAIVARRYAVAAFGALWVTLAFLGLLVVYWISTIPIGLALVWSGDRTIITVVVGATTLAAVLVGAANDLAVQGMRFGSGREAAAFRDVAVADPRERMRDLRNT